MALINLSNMSLRVPFFGGGGGREVVDNVDARSLINTHILAAS